MRIPLGRWLAASLLALVSAGVTGLWLAPAAWLDRGLAAATDGRLRLADTSGTVWEGSGRLVLVDVGERAVQRQSLVGMPLPGRLQWSVARLPLLLGLVSAQVAVEGMQQPVRFEGSFRELRISAGSLSLPRMQLEALGSPWNTVRPAAAVVLRWDAIVVASGIVQGRLVAELRDVSSALTAVRPIGSYRIEFSTRDGQGELSLSTIDGALKLSGSGRLTNRGLSVAAEAQPAQPDDPRLQGVLSLIGRREGNRTLIRIGA